MIYFHQEKSASGYSLVKRSLQLVYHILHCAVQRRISTLHGVVLHWRSNFYDMVGAVPIWSTLITCIHRLQELYK